MSTGQRLNKFLRECRGRGAGEYALLAVFWAAGLAVALAAFLGSRLGKAIITASYLN